MNNAELNGALGGQVVQPLAPAGAILPQLCWQLISLPTLKTLL